MHFVVNHHNKHRIGIKFAVDGTIKVFCSGKKLHGICSECQVLVSVGIGILIQDLFKDL